MARLACLTAIAGLSATSYARFHDAQDREERRQRRAGALSPGTFDPAWLELDAGELGAVIRTPLASGSRSMLVLRALTSAACADPRVCLRELRSALRRIASGCFRVPERSVLLHEVTTPIGPKRLAGRIDDRASAVNVYAASALAVDRRIPEMRTHLSRLAAQLQLPEGLATAIHAGAVYAMVSGSGGLPRPLVERIDDARRSAA